MKKALIIIMLILLSITAAKATYPEKGYRGFVDWNMEFGWYQAERYVSDNLTYTEKYTPFYMLYGLSTSHGYQFNPHFFLGAGIWFQGGAGELLRKSLEIPVFLHGRTDWTFGKVPLYFDLRIGVSRGMRYLKAVEDKIFISPGAGYRLDWGKRISANVGIGVSLHGGNFNHFTFVPLPSLRLGIEF